MHRFFLCDTCTVTSRDEQSAAQKCPSCPDSTDAVVAICVTCALIDAMCQVCRCDLKSEIPWSDRKKIGNSYKARSWARAKADAGNEAALECYLAGCEYSQASKPYQEASHKAAADLRALEAKEQGTPTDAASASILDARNKLSLTRQLEEESCSALAEGMRVREAIARRILRTDSSLGYGRAIEALRQVAERAERRHDDIVKRVLEDAHSARLYRRQLEEIASRNCYKLSPADYRKLMTKPLARSRAR